MSRSGYRDDIDTWALIRWRGAVASAIRGRRGQSFLREMLAALDDLSEKKLVAGELETEDGQVCALGAVGVARNMNLRELDPEDRKRVAALFGAPFSLACEIAHANDEEFSTATPEERFALMRGWIMNRLHNEEEKDE